MKQILNKIGLNVGFAIMLTMSSCGMGSSDSVDFIPAKSEKNSNWGMLGPDGKMLFEDEFKHKPSAVFNGYFTVEGDNGVSVYSLDGNKPKAVSSLENLVYAGYMSEGIIPVSRKGSRIEYYDSKGKLKFTLDPYKGNEITRVSGRFYEGIATVWLENDRCGAINSSGKMVVEPKFSHICDFNDGLALAIIPKAEKDTTEEVNWVVIDSKGNEKFKLKGMTPDSYSFQDGYLAVSKEDRYGLLNKKGEFLKLPEKVKSIVNYNSKYVLFAGDEGKGVMSLNGEVVVRPKYSDIGFLTEDKFIAKSDNEKFYIVNDKDERETELADVKQATVLYYWCQKFNIRTEFNIIVNEGEHEYKIYDGNGKPISKTDYYDISLNLPSSVVYSDYFNPEALANKLSNLFTLDGFNGVKLGSPFYLCFKDKTPEDVKYNSDYKFEDIEGGYKYSLDGEVDGTEDVVTSTPIYRTETYGYYYSYSYQTFDHYEYSWNKNSFVNKIIIGGEVEVADQYPEIKDALVKKLSEKGFKKEANEKSYALLTSEKAAIFITLAGKNGSSFVVAMVSKSLWNSNRNTFINMAVNSYNESSLGKNGKTVYNDAIIEDSTEFEDSTELVTSVVAETAVAVDW